jgi:hypothetical protein
LDLKLKSAEDSAKQPMTGNAAHRCSSCYPGYTALKTACLSGSCKL